MNILTTEENLFSEEMVTSRKLLDTKKSLKMCDFPTEDQFEPDLISKTKVKPIMLKEEKVNNIFKMKSIKLSKKNTLSKEQMEAEANKNILTNYNIAKPDVTISLISENKDTEKGKDSIAASFRSHSIEFYKNDLMFNGADVAFPKRLSASTVNENNLLNSIEGEDENSQYLDVQVNNELLENLNKQENTKEFKEQNFESSIQRDEKKNATFIDTNPIRKQFSLLTNIISPKKVTKKLANNEFNNYIKNLLTKNDEDKTEILPNELKFIHDIHKNENRLVDDVEISSCFNKYQVAQFIETVFTIIGMASGILYYEIKRDSTLTSVDSVLNTCLIVCSVANLLFIVASILKYIIFIRLKKALVDYSKKRNFWNTYVWIPLFFEILMSIAQPNIFCKDIYFKTNVNWYILEVEYCVNDYLMIVLLLKVYVVYRSVISLSDFSGERADRVMKMFGGDTCSLFAIKCMIRENPFFIIFFFFISCNLILSYLMKIIEGPVYLINEDSQNNLNDFRSFSNCMWYTFITMATVGFGDYYPKTNFGRLIGIADAIIGTVFVSLFIIYLQRTLSLNPTEKTAVDFLNRLKYKDMLKTKASFLFLNSFRYQKAKRKYLNELKNPKRTPNSIEKCKSNVEDIFYEKTSFNKLFKRLIHVFRNIYELPSDYDMMINKIKDTEKKVENLKDRGNIIKNSLDEISGLLKNIVTHVKL